MKGLDWEPCERESLTIFDRFLLSLNPAPDSFFECLLREARFFRLLGPGGEVGFFAIHGEDALTGFYLSPAHRKASRERFAAILAETNVASALVTTGDPFFLRHALEAAERTEKVALFFEEAVPGKPPSFVSDVTYRIAEPSDLALLAEMGGDFLSNPAEWIGRREAYLGFRMGEPVAIGVAEAGRLFPHLASIGMLTVESVRGQGIGTSTLAYLRGICHERGVTPIAGCAYGNDASRKTLEAAGMVSSTLALRVGF